MSNTEETAEVVTIRRANPEDMARVVREWINSFRGSRWAGPIPNNLFKRVYSEAIRQLLTRGAVVHVACFKEKPALLLGFACTEHTPRDRILHYVFVRSDYRQQGVANALLESAGIDRRQPFVYTYRTDDAAFICRGSKHMKELAARKDAYKADDVPQSQEMN